MSERVPGPDGVIEPVVHEFLPRDALAEGLRRDVAEGLVKTPKSLPPKWFYDERGSELFDQITRLDEYYPTRAERSILEARAAEIVKLSEASTLVELGSGTADKTRVIIDEMIAAVDSPSYVPFDVSPEFLRESTRLLAEEFPGLFVEGVVGDLDHHLPLIPDRPGRLIAFLGGTVGNYEPDGRAQLLAAIADTMNGGDHLLLGTDLVKDTDRLVAAYDDAAGVTAEFNRNVLHVINRELAADFDVESFTHVARWDPENEWIGMWLRSELAQTVTIGALDLTVTMARGEEIHTEISSKFRLSGVEAELAAVGLTVVEQWTDTDGDFGLTLARKA